MVWWKHTQSELLWDVFSYATCMENVFKYYLRQKFNDSFRRVSMEDVGKYFHHCGGRFRVADLTDD